MYKKTPRLSWVQFGFIDEQKTTPVLKLILVSNFLLFRFKFLIILMLNIFLQVVIVFYKPLIFFYKLLVFIYSVLLYFQVSKICFSMPNFYFDFKMDFKSYR